MAEFIAMPIGLIIIFGMAVFFIFMAWPLVFPGAPFLPSYRKSNQTARAHLKNIIDFAKISFPNGRFIDLGSGDGRVVIEFARHGFESWGVEFNPFLVLWSRIKIKNSKLKSQKAKVVRANFWNFNLSGFDIVYIFQLTSVNALLADKFKKELKPGAIIISAGFFLPNLELIKKEGIFGVYRN